MVDCELHSDRAPPFFFFLFIRRPPNSPLFPSPPFFGPRPRPDQPRLHQLAGDLAVQQHRPGDHAQPLDRPAGQRQFDPSRSEEHTSELQSRQYLVCRLLLDKTMKLAGDLASTYRWITLL